ncbi:MAG: hypothetical protein ABSC48_05435 [Terracidiphilus sp.]|jgi:hypothetical protein
MQHRTISHPLSWFAVTSLALAIVFSPARANASGELCNMFLSPLTTGGWTSLTLVVEGDISQDDAQASLVPGLDPFYAYNPSNAKVSISYNATLNQTTITFTGGPLPANYTNIPGHDPHVGIANITNGGWCSIISYAWGMAGPPTTQSGPAVGVENSNGFPANPTGYYILYLQYTQGSPATAGGVWTEIPYIGSLPSWRLVTGKASPSNPIDFNVAGYWTSPTEIPLDKLNFADMNPGRSAFGSPWNRLPNPPPLTSQVP